MLTLDKAFQEQDFRCECPIPILTKCGHSLKTADSNAIEHTPIRCLCARLSGQVHGAVIDAQKCTIGVNGLILENHHCFATVGLKIATACLASTGAGHKQQE